jgi:hypothetical protein
LADFNKSKPGRLEEFRAAPPRFVCEQDGPPEREFKKGLVAFLERAPFVNRAYLARVTYGTSSELHVALCVKGQPGQNRLFAERAGSIFASIFGSHEHVDIIWLMPDQEVALAKVCRPFFPVGPTA